jgi:PAS domain S-box-containing protein
MADRMSISAGKFLSWFSRFTSGLAMAFGALVLTGWILHVHRLKGLIPGQVAVKANTAVCFILIGLALWLAVAGPRKPIAQALSRWLALAATIVGLLSFLEFWYGWDFGIDQLLFTAGPEDLPGSVRRGLMSPVAAADFFLLGITIALLDVRERWSHWVQSLFATTATVASVFGILDFVLDPKSTHTYIAPLTALILFLFSFSVLCARTEWGLGALLVSLTPGGELSRRLLPAAILLPIAIGWLRWKGQQTGAFSDWTGIVVMMVSSGALLAGLTFWTAFALDRVELAREHAEESARRLAAIVTSSNDAIIGKTLEGIVTSWNPGAEAIYGYSAEEMIGQPVNRVIPADRLDEFEGFLQQLRRGETVRVYETERIRKDGKRIAVAVCISPLKDEKGRVVGASTIARDISERKRAEQALADERRRFEAVLDRLPVMVCLLRPDYSVAFANQSFRRQFGESNGRKCYEFCFGKTAPCEFCQSFDVLKKGQPIDWEVETNSGRAIHAFDFPFADTDGSPLVLEMDIDVTEQKEAERKIKEASRYTRNLIEASLDPLVTISKEGKITDVNQATETATGLSRDRLIGSDFCDYFTEPEKAREGYRRVFEEGMVRDYPLAIRTRSGAVMDVLYNATVLKGADGEVEGVFAAARDITRRKQAEEEALAGRDRLAQAMTAAKAGSFDWNILTNLDLWSREKELLYGLKPGEFSGTHQDWEAFVLPEDRPHVKALVDLAFQTGDFAAEFRIRRRDNREIRWMNVRAKVVFGNDGKPSRMVGINLDITDRKLAEERVLEASRYTRTLIEASLDPLVTISADGKITDVNQATEKATGMSRDHLIGSDFSKYFTEPERARQGYRQVFSTGLVRDYPLMLRHTSGSVMEVLYNATVFRNARGEVDGVFAAARDITERKHAEEALHRSESRYRSLVTATAQIVWTTDRNGQVTDDMPMWREYTGTTWKEIAGAGWLSSLHPDDRDHTEQVWAKAWRNRERYDTEYRIRRRDGEYRTFSVRGVPVLENDDTVREWVGTCTDITERKLAEEQVRRLNEELEQRVVQRTAQLEAANKELEAFTYSVSHDLRAPLRHISGFSKMLSEEFSADLPAEAQHHLQRIQEGTRRMGQLVDDLLNLGRVGRKELSLQVAGLRSIVDEVIRNLKSEVGDRQVEWKVGDLPYVECDTALMGQVFQNLLSNALKFTRPREHAVIEIGQERRNSGSAVFVRDNGVGFSMKYADKLFGVFQRLHRAEDFEGTGVGLATVQRILQKHGGRIWAEAELDKGASFYFTLGSSQSSEANSKALAAGEKS